MADRPILMSAPMVRAILAGTKTQTRRVVKPQPRILAGELLCWKDDALTDDQMAARCPYGQPGDQLWLRETWARDDEDGAYFYRADVGTRNGADDWQHNIDVGASGYRWRPSIHMPRAASRITLEVTNVRVERLHDILCSDAEAEGIVEQPGGGWGLADSTHYHFTDPRASYWSLWEAINGPGSVEANPWVWVVEFRRHA